MVAKQAAEKTDETQGQERKIKTKKEDSAEANATEENAGNDTAPQEEAGDESLSPIKKDMLETVRSFFEETMNAPVRITAMMDAENGWDIEVELVEEQAYTQRYGRDQLIGIYEATMNNDQKITSYQRKNTRPRSTPFEKAE